MGTLNITVKIETTAEVTIMYSELPCGEVVDVPVNWEALVERVNNLTHTYAIGGFTLKLTLTNTQITCRDSAELLVKTKSALTGYLS